MSELTWNVEALEETLTMHDLEVVIWNEETMVDDYFFESDLAVVDSEEFAA